jgi:Uncharacterized protein conserved in bacteria (DUF2169)
LVFCRRVDVAALCPFEVGIVRWRAPSPALTVIVKSTWTLAPGELAVAPVQEAVVGDRFGAGQEGLVWASDFVPYKPRVDVLLLGKAHASAATASIAVRLRVDDLDRVVYALSGQPAEEIPLAAPYLRVESRPGAAATAVGPVPAWVVRPPGSSPDAGLLGASGQPRGPLRADFDFGLFNVAPPEQQVAPSLREDARVVLEGVLSGGARLDARLPGVRPRVYLVDDAGGPTQELAVTFDTLVIDAERSICVLVWRGAVVLDEGRSEPSLVVVATERLSEPIEWAGVLGDIFAARRARAAELDDEPALPRLNEPEDSSRWSDESTTRVRNAHGSKAPPAAPSAREGQTRVDVRAPRPARIPDDESADRIEVGAADLDTSTENKPR